MQFLCSPLLGALSDRYGRRPVILISCLGLGLDYIFMAVAPSLTPAVRRPHHLRHHRGHHQHRLRLHRRRHAARRAAPRRSASSAWRFGLGFVLGPALGGLLGGLDPRLPFWVSAAACLANAAFGWFVLPGSLPPERRMALRLEARQSRGLAQAARARTASCWAWRRSTSSSTSPIRSLPSVFVLYAAYRYGWGETTVGLTLAFVGVCTALVQGLVVGPAVERLGTRRALIAGLLCGSLGMAIYGLAPTGPWFWLGVPVMALWGVVGPVAPWT